MRTSFLGVLAITAFLTVGCASNETRDPAPVASRVDRLPPLYDLDGNRFDLAAARAEGAPLALVFWQTWCESCANEAPDVVEAAMLNPSMRFFGIVSGSDDYVDSGEVRATADAWRIPYPTLRDRDGSFASALGVRGTPMIVVLDGAGTVRYKSPRPPADWKAFAAGS